MKKVLLFNLLAVFASFCMAQTQLELNANAKTKYESTDKELKKVYSDILKEYNTDTVFIKNLKKSQSLWAQIRNTEMKLKYPDRSSGYYGSVQPMCWWIYKEELTRQRIKFLKSWLDGVEEGDVCNGSVKIKAE
jgi:uncharacterized protein YecT (DUF1311 family)